MSSLKAPRLARSTIVAFVADFLVCPATFAASKAYC